MKQYRILSIFLVSTALSCVWSCQEEGTYVHDNGQMVVVSFSPEIDGVEMSTVPFETRTAEEEATYYLLKIDQVTKTSGDAYHAYGIFDSFGDHVSIQLSSGQNYRFSLLVIKETESGHLVYVNDRQEFNLPFAERNFVALTNRFVEGTNPTITYSARCLDDNPNTAFYNSFIYRYVGYTTVENLQNGGKISIPLKKYYFAVNLDITRPIDGSLVVSIPDFGFTETIEAGDGQVNVFRIVNSRQEATLDAEDSFSEEHEIEVRWDRDPILTSFDIKKTFSFCKGMRHNINVNLNDRAGSTGFDFQLEGASDLPETTYVVD